MGSQASCCLSTPIVQESLEIESKHDQSTLQCLYPMWVMPVRKLLELEGELEPHQVLRQKGLLVKYIPGMGKVLFVSHQWRGGDLPDPERLQIKVLQEALPLIVSGKLRLTLEMRLEAGGVTLDSLIGPDELNGALDWFVWYDYFSCPQITARGSLHASNSGDLLKAVDSIPFYIDESKYFLVLAPSTKHAVSGGYTGYRTWQERGWCRVEQAGCVLSINQKPLMCLESVTSFKVISGFDWLTKWPGEGKFAVESDRPRVVEIMGRLLAQREQHELSKNNVGFFRLLTALEYIAMRGLPQAKAQENTSINAFLERYKFGSSEDAAAEEGFTPVMCAAMEDNCTMVQQLITAKADVNASISSGFAAEFGLLQGTTIVGIACRVSSSKMVRTLLDLKAGLNDTCDQLKEKPLHKAASAGNTPVVELLIEMKASVASEDMFGGQPLMMAVISNSYDATKALLAAKADVNYANEYGATSGQAAGMYRCDVGIVQLLIQYNMDVHACFPAKSDAALGFSKMAHEMYEKGDPLGELLSGMAVQPAPPLHFAAWSGLTEMAKELLKAKADPGTKMWDEKSTAYDIALWRGHKEVADVLSMAQVSKPGA